MNIKRSARASAIWTQKVLRGIRISSAARRAPLVISLLWIINKSAQAHKWKNHNPRARIYIYTVRAEQEIENFAARVQKTFSAETLILGESLVFFICAAHASTFTLTEVYIMRCFEWSVCRQRFFCARQSDNYMDGAWIHSRALTLALIITERCKGGSKIFTNDDYLSTSSTICFPPEITGLLF